MEWRPVVGFERTYEVSATGLVRRIGAGRGASPGRLLTPGARPDGYSNIILWQGNIGSRFTLHRIVAAAFLGPCPPGQEVDHRDGVKANNAAANLEYVSRSENLERRVARGIGVGESNGAARLSAEQVREIRRRHADGEGYKRLGTAFGRPWGTIRNVCTRRTWRHVP